MNIKIISYNVDENFDKGILAKLPRMIEVPITEISSATPNDDVFEYINDKVGVPAYEYEILPTRKNAEELWENLTDVCVNENDEIESEWFRFDVGASKYTIWDWFYEYFGIKPWEEFD